MDNDTTSGKEGHYKILKTFAEHKADILRKAFARFPKDTKDWQSFLSAGEYYEFALFRALKKKFNDRPWTEWDEDYKTADKKTIERFVKENEDELAFWQFTQFLFLKQIF